MTLRRAGFCAALSCFMMFALVGQLSANPLWEWVNPLPQGHRLIDVIAVEGMLVAVGEAGSVVTSTDGGETWSVRHTSTEYALINVEWGNGRFIAVSRSAPGLSLLWRRRRFSVLPLRPCLVTCWV